MKAESFEHYYNSGYLLLFGFSIAALEHPRRVELLHFLGSLGVCMAGAGSVFIQDTIPLHELQQRLDPFLHAGDGVMVIPLSGQGLTAYMLSSPKDELTESHLDWIEGYRQMTPEQRSNRFTRKSDFALTETRPNPNQ
jgi:hypothetical protein